MRLSDIINFRDRNKIDRKKFPYTLSDSGSSKDSKGVSISRLSIAEDASLDKDSDETKAMKELYNEQLAQIRMIFNDAMADFHTTPAKGSLQDLTRQTVDKLSVCNIDIMDLFMKSEEGNYLYSHSLNVYLMSVMLGIWLNYNKSDLIQLAIAALLHDIGMVKVINIALLTRQLTPSEREEINQHAAYSAEFFHSIKDMDKEVIEAVYNHHRRLNLTGDVVCGYSQIIGLADTFEAMTHPRVYKGAIDPHSAIRKIIDEMREAFDSRIIKVLIDNIGLYPAGTWVRLDTEEIGLVIDTNTGLPLSPKVNILFSRDNERLPESRTVDLSRQKNIHIKGPLGEEAIKSLRKEVC